MKHKLLIDFREKDRIPIIKKYCKKWDWEYEVKELTYGDYVSGNTVIEYKTVTDFCSSIVNGRLKKESINQANNYPYHFVFVVGNLEKGMKLYNNFGNKKGTYKNFSYPQIWGAVASLVQYTHILFLEDTRRAFFQMKAIMSRCNKDNKRIIIKVDKLSSNPCFNFLNSIHKIGVTTAENICTELQLNCLEDLISMKEEDLKTVNQVGYDKVKRIMKSIHG